MTQSVGRITESRTDAEWGRPAKLVKNCSWFNGREYTPAQLSLGQETERQWYAYDATALIIKGNCAYGGSSTSVGDGGALSVELDFGHSNSETQIKAASSRSP